VGDGSKRFLGRREITTEMALTNSDREGKKMLSFTIHKLGNSSLFRCAGRLVSDNVESLREAIQSQMQARTVVLDLAEIAGIDAAGIGVLLSVRESTRASGAAFKLMNLNPRVEKVLELTSLSAAFELCSVAEMLDLLCHAMRQAPPAPVEAIELPEPRAEYAIAASGATGNGS
jgi:anti-sigma B factor antagonist